MVDIDAAAEIWREACSSIGLPKTKGKEKSRPAVDVRLSNDVGLYVCGFSYYVSLLEMQKQTGRRDVVFFHVLTLETEEGTCTGVQVMEELMKVLVAVWQH